VANFSGQGVLITGASSGIGEALAREFARRGAALVLAARRTDRLDRLVAELTAGGARAVAVRCDVTVDGEPERAAAAARERFGRLDVVVANAGFGVVGPFALLTLDDYRRQFETNVFGVLRTLKATLADVRRTRGRIAVIGSVSGHIATPGSSPYAMSKFAVRALAEALGHELARSGVSVTLVSPGYVASEIPAHVDDARGAPDRARDRVAAPRGRRHRSRQGGRVLSAARAVADVRRHPEVRRPEPGRAGALSARRSAR